MRTTKKLYQWDTDQKLINCVGKYVDFPIGDGVYRIDVIDKECIIPDELLQVSGTVKVYECMEYGTVKAFAFYTNPRPKPPDYVFTPTQRLTFEGLVKKVDETIEDLQKRADSGEFNGSDYVITESDYDAIAAKTAGKLQPTIGELARTLETEKTDREQSDISLQKDISGKLSEPVEGLAVGKYFRVAQIDGNGHAVLEAVDAKSIGVQDVQINGESIVNGENGVVDLPLANDTKLGIVTSAGSNYGIGISGGLASLNLAVQNEIDARTTCKVISPQNIDYAVKAAMCDGKGAAWTADEQAAARERIGTDGGEMELIAEVTTEEELEVISVSKFPDDTQLKLKSFMIYFVIPKASNNSLITSGYTLNYANNLSAIRDSSNNLIKSGFNTHNNMYVMWNNARPIGFVTKVASWANGSAEIESVVKYDNNLGNNANYISEVHLSQSGGGIKIPIGTMLKLYGVRV